MFGMVTPSISLSHPLTSAESIGGGEVQFEGHWVAAKLTGKGKEQVRSERVSEEGGDKEEAVK